MWAAALCFALESLLNQDPRSKGTRSCQAARKESPRRAEIAVEWTTPWMISAKSFFTQQHGAITIKPPEDPCCPLLHRTEPNIIYKSQHCRLRQSGQLSM
eukprot:364145-Amphidinium_carterae.1